MRSTLWGHARAWESRLRALARDEDAVTAVEYGLIAALIAAVIIGAVQGLGSKLVSTFDTVSGQLK